MEQTPGSEVKEEVKVEEKKKTAEESMKNLLESYPKMLKQAQMELQLIPIVFMISAQTMKDAGPDAFYKGKFALEGFQDSLEKTLVTVKGLLEKEFAGS